MRSVSLFLTCAASVLLISGCGTAVSPHWRDDAIKRFDTAISAGVDSFAPEETDNIRQTLALADRYFNSDMTDDADRLYQLSSQKCQLVYRNLVLSRIADGATIALESRQSRQAEELQISREHISLNDVLREEEYTANPSDADINKSTHQITAKKSQPSPRRTGAKTTGSSLPELTSRHTDPAGTTIYLTFDDGPSRLTLPIATYLTSQGIQATFFVLGTNIKGREKTISATIAMGHRVGNHTLTHNLRKLKASVATAASEVKRAGDLIEKLGGDGRMVRIPYGATDRSIVSNVTAEGAQLFYWDINSHDSSQRGVRDHFFIEKAVLRQLNRSAKKHVILLFHDGAGHDSTLTALRDLIPRLKKEGYRFGLLARIEKMAARTSENRQQVQ